MIKRKKRVMSWPVIFGRSSRDEHKYQHFSRLQVDIPITQDYHGRLENDSVLLLLVRTAMSL
jgi:hypothetical protein